MNSLHVSRAHNLAMVQAEYPALPNNGPDTKMHKVQRKHEVYLITLRLPPRSHLIPSFPLLP